LVSQRQLAASVALWRIVIPLANFGHLRLHPILEIFIRDCESFAVRKKRAIFITPPHRRLFMGIGYRDRASGGDIHAGIGAGRC
jgi:hypothetical protein